MPWELGLAEAHQVLMRNGLRDRVALRTDGGLQTGRDVVMAALLGAEEYGFGTAALIALGCDMARQCHLDTCPTGIATQREDLRAKFTGTPEDVVALLHGHRRGRPPRAAATRARARVAEIVGDATLLDRATDRMRDARPRPACSPRPPWPAAADRRRTRARARSRSQREPASPAEARLAGRVRAPAATSSRTERVPVVEHPMRRRSEAVGIAATITTAERSFGAHTLGAHRARRASAGRSAGASRARPARASARSANEDVSLELVGQANDYVGKGLSGGKVIVPAGRESSSGPPTSRSRATPASTARPVGGCILSAGRASGSRCATAALSAVVEGVGAHGCEYMTGGVVVILGAVGANLGAGMTGGRAYLWDPDGTASQAADGSSVRWTRMRAIVSAGARGWSRAGRGASRLLEAHGRPDRRWPGSSWHAGSRA